MSDQRRQLSAPQKKYYNESAVQSMQQRRQYQDEISSQQQSMPMSFAVQSQQILEEVQYKDDVAELKKASVKDKIQTKSAPLEAEKKGGFFSNLFGGSKPQVQQTQQVPMSYAVQQQQVPMSSFSQQQQIPMNFSLSQQTSFNSNVQQQYKSADGTVFDEHGNQANDEFDLGKDGAFSDFSVLCGIFYGEVASSWDRNAGAALKKKGFRTTVTTSESQFTTFLKKKEHDVAIIVSSSSWGSGDQNQFVEAVLDFHKDKRGLFIFGDNDPWYYHCNLILPKIADCKMEGNNPGNRTLEFGTEPTKPGIFDENHLIFAGISKLFEGVTICYPNTMGSLTPLATGTDGKVCIAAMERSSNGGRVVVDTGFTKLYINWQSAGQARYMINSCVYLVDIEGRFGDSATEEPKTTENSETKPQ